MAIFNKEQEFGSRAALPFEPDQPFIRRFVDFVAGHAFVLNIPVTILAYIRTPRLRSDNLVTTLAYITFSYLGLIAIPAITATVLASPALLAWKTRKQHLFTLVFETIFVFLYLLFALVTLIVPSVRPN
jgi:hypothetical protein